MTFYAIYSIFLSIIPDVFVTKSIENVVCKKLRLDWERCFYKRGVAKDLKKAHKRFVKARKYGVVFSKELLTDIANEMVKSDTEKLYYLGIRASELDDHNTALELGNHYKSLKNIDEAVYYYKIAAKNNHLEAQLFLFNLYNEKHNYYDAYRYYLPLSDEKNLEKLQELNQLDDINKFILNFNLTCENHCINCLNEEFYEINYEFYEENWRNIYYCAWISYDFSDIYESLRTIRYGKRRIESPRKLILTTYCRSE